MKDRLAEFQEMAMRSNPSLFSPSASTTSVEGDLEKGLVASGEMIEKSSHVTPIDQFLVAMEEVKGTLEKINKNIDDIEKFHRQALTATSLEEANRLSLLIDELVNRINNKDAQRVRASIKAITAETEKLKGTRQITPSDLRLRTSQQHRLAKQFMASMSRFQQMQSTYQAKYRQQLERQYLIVKPTATRDELDSLTNVSGATSLLNQQIFSMVNKAQAQKTLSEMKERHHDIMAIEKSLQELHQMFLDMSLVVEQQGEAIDKIEDYVNGVAEYTENAAEEMRSAVVKHRKMQKKRWIILIICAVLIIVVGLILLQEFFGIFNGMTKK